MILLQICSIGQPDLAFAPSFLNRVRSVALFRQMVGRCRSHFFRGRPLGVSSNGCMGWYGGELFPAGFNFRCSCENVRR